MNRPPTTPGSVGYDNTGTRASCLEFCSSHYNIFFSQIFKHNSITPSHSYIYAFFNIRVFTYVG